MRIWRITPRASLLGRRTRFRQFATDAHERIQVPCGSSGHVAIDLFNLAAHSPQTSLLLHLPAFPTADGVTSPAHLPGFLQGWPVASINYRWGTGDDSFTNSNNASTPLRWPTPVHDTAFAFSWLLENLAPPGNTARRDMLVYGSYLGASLATSLALTQSHTHQRFGIRGVAAYNGVYNWTTFLPEHPMWRRKRTKKSLDRLLVAEPLASGAHMEGFLEEMPGLFGQPGNLFDPFASPSLFFHGPGLDVPGSFNEPASPLSEMVTAMVGLNVTGSKAIPMKPPRKSHLIFPPRASTIKLPQTLLLHDEAPPKTSSSPRSRRKPTQNTFKLQADELAELMRRSIDKVEMKERVKWDDDIEGWGEEASRRVQVVELGEERRDLQLGEHGQEEVRTWLEGVM